MPRRPRLAIPGVPLHVTQRGNNRAACFIGDSDRLVYLDLLGQHTRLRGVAVHAYVLMTNHVHLLMTPASEGAIGHAMRHVNQRYARYFNRRHNRTGTLWESRPFSCLVEAEAYLFTCHRYIENNPVRAGLVAKPDDYPWSSYRANAAGRPDPILTPHPVVFALGNSNEERQAEYRELFRDDPGPGAFDQLRRMTSAGLVLGRDSFTARVEKELGRRAGPGIPGRPWAKEK